MVISSDLLLNAVAAGILLGGFYALIALGATISFGLLDVVNIAQPAFIVAGSYLTYFLSVRIGLNPILSGLLLAPFFFGAGVLLYRWYYHAFERRESDSLRALGFFFGLMFITEVTLIILFGVDLRSVPVPFEHANLQLGPVGIPARMLIPFIISVLMVFAVQWFLSRTFAGRAVMAVAQDRVALQLMGVDPVRTKAYAFGLSLAIAALAGAMLIVIQPVEPALGRQYIGVMFAVVVLGGMSSVMGTLLAAIIIGILESVTTSIWGPSWSPAIAFGVLFLAFFFRPQGLMGR